MTTKQKIEKILDEEYTDQCRHEHGVTWVIPSGIYTECEGGQIKVICNCCKQELETLTDYE